MSLTSLSQTTFSIFARDRMVPPGSRLFEEKLLNQPDELLLLMAVPFTFNMYISSSSAFFVKPPAIFRYPDTLVSGEYMKLVWLYTDPITCTCAGFEGMKSSSPSSRAMLY